MLYQKTNLRLCSHVVLSALAYISLLFSGYAAAFDKPQSGETLEAVFGKEDQLPITFDHWTAGSNIIIGGGGPFLDNEIRLDADVVALAQSGHITFAATNDNRILAIDWENAENVDRGGAARAVATATLKSAVNRLYVFENRLVASNVNNEIIFFHFDNAQLLLLGSHKFNQPISDLSLDNQRCVILLANQTLHYFHFQASVDNRVDISGNQVLQLSHKAQSITHFGDNVLIAGPELGLALYRFVDNGDIQLIDTYYSNGQAYTMKYQDGIVYVADGEKGAAIYQIDEMNHIQWVGSHGKLGSVDQLWPMADMLLVLNQRWRFAGLNIDDPRLPITGSIYKPGQAIDHATAADGYAYAAQRSTIQRIDFRHSGATQISNEGINLGGSRRAYVKNHIAYVADWFSGLHIYDMRIPQQPRHLGNYHTPGSSKGVVVENNIAYVADDDHGLQIIDVADPVNPRLLSHINSTGLAYTLKYYRKKIYLADHRGGFHIIDVANPKKPREITHFDTPGKAWAIAVKDQYVFVADDQSGLLIFDASVPSRPKEIGQYKPGGYAEDLQIVGNLAYVSFFDQGFHIIDISNPRKPRRVSALAIPGNARSVSIRDNLAFIAGWESGLQVVDIADTKHPKLVANLDTSGSTWGVDIEGDFAYLWDWWGGVKIADISDPRQPRLLAQYQDGDLIHALAIEKNHAFVAQGGNGLQVFDITNPANPIWMTGLNLPGVASTIVTSTERAYVGLGSAGIAVIDIKNPFAVRLLSRIPVDADIRHMLYNDGTLYYASDKNEIVQIDPLSANTSRPLRRWNGDVNSWAITNNRLIYANSKGLHGIALDQNSGAFARYLPASEFTCLTALTDIIAACAKDGSIHVLRLNADRFEQVAILSGTRRLHSLLLQDHWLFSYDDLDGVTQYDLSHPSQPRVSARYRATGSDKKMAWYGNALLFTGNKTPNSLPLLPALSVEVSAAPEKTLHVPGTLEMGYYHLWLQNPNGQRWFYPNSLHVGLKRARKPSISMEKFKQLMQEQLQLQSQSKPATAKPSDSPKK